MFASRPAADLAAMSASLRYVHDAPGNDPVAGFLLSETLCLLTRALERREGDFRRLPGRRDDAIGRCQGLRIHAETLRLSYTGSSSTDQKRRDLSRLIDRLDRNIRKIDPRRQVRKPDRIHA